MIHVTITDLDNNEVKFDKDVNAVIIGTSDEGDISSGTVGSLKELAFAYVGISDAIKELSERHPEFLALYHFLRNMQDLDLSDDEDDDANE